jgi:hypothetical protein
LVALSPALDLLFRAKHLFVAAIVAAIHRGFSRPGPACADRVKDFPPLARVPCWPQSSLLNRPLGSGGSKNFRCTAAMARCIVPGPGSHPASRLATSCKKAARRWTGSGLAAARRREVVRQFFNDFWMSSNDKPGTFAQRLNRAEGHINERLAARGETWQLDGTTREQLGLPPAKTV